MAMFLRHQVQPPALAESLRFYIVQEPENKMIPVVPVDQLPYQIQGIPSQLSHRQVSEEKWTFLNETSETRAILPANISMRPAVHALSPSSVHPTPPRYLAPDHNVMSNTGNDSRVHSRTPLSCPPTSVERHETKAETNARDSMEPITRYVEPTPSFQRNHVMMDTNLRSKIAQLTRSTRVPSSTEQKPSATADYQGIYSSLPVYNQNSSSIEQKSSSRISTNHSPISGQGTSYTHDSSVPPQNDPAMNNAKHNTKPEPSASSRSPISHHLEKDHITAGTDSSTDSGIDSRSRPTHIRSSSHEEKQRVLMKKEYCNHWIQFGECSWGDHRCLYKHEMPTIEVLRQVTGFKKVPQWWKDKMAIQSMAPTWMERRLQQQDKKDSDDQREGSKMPAIREFPDPSTLRGLRQKSGGAIKQNVPAPKDTKEQNPALLLGPLIDLNPPTSATLSSPPASTTVSDQEHLENEPVPSSVPAVERKASLTRHHSQTSSPPDTSSSTKTAKSLWKPKKKGKNYKQITLQQSKKTGLSASKWSPTNDEMCIIDRPPTRCEIPTRLTRREDDTMVEVRGQGSTTLVSLI
ncbi:hypothetical protein N0V90_007483 [Kalmusia sp. IMI 367209]|nr:hypothetical protein N0V90_007483 [Kalmusia sp. IMI 367209]